MRQPGRGRHSGIPNRLARKIMQHKSENHQRRSMRLRGYDYSQAGAYFVTICTHHRVSTFGEVVGGEIRLNLCGQAVVECWCQLPDHYPHARLDAFVVMPNHMHGIIGLIDDVGAGLKPAPTQRHPLSEIVRGFKTFSSRRINQLRHSPGVPVWQRNYYEHVVRNDSDLDAIRKYIVDNPAKWTDDTENAQHFGACGHGIPRPK